MGEFSEVHSPEAKAKHNDVLYISLKFPPGLSNRDVCEFRRVHKDTSDGSAVAMFRSCEISTCPSVSKFIRVATHRTAFLIEPMASDPGSCVVTFTVHSDLKAPIPKSIFNYVSATTPFILIDGLTKACRRYLERKEHDPEWQAL